MIYRPLKFQVEYQTGVTGGYQWVRENVSEMLCTPAMGVTSVKTESGKELGIDPITVSVLQFTGVFDRDAKEIYHAHLLADDKGNIYEVMIAEGSFLLVKDQESKPLTNEIAMTLHIVGDALHDAKLLMPEKPEEIFKASAERKELPPIVTLKKK